VTQIKICGIRTIPIYDLICELEIDFVGINFSPKSKRCITESEWHKLQDRHIQNSQFKPKLVYVFFENDLDHAKSILIQSPKPDYLQFVVGDSKEKDLLQLASEFHLELLPSYRITENNPILPYPKSSLFILDSFAPGQGGGTGHGFPWEFAKEITRPYLLAGGIHPKNVRDAIQILSPYGIDVASGVESNGEKDPELVRALALHVRKGPT